LPVKVLGRVFRGKFVSGLKRAFRQGELVFPGGLAGKGEAFHAFLRPLFRQDWVVYAKRPFGGPEYVLHYLARYTHRVAISNHRLLSVADGKVTFRWKDYAHGGKATQDVGHRRRVPAALHAPCAATRLRPDSLFRLPRQSAPETTSAPLQPWLPPDAQVVLGDVTRPDTLLGAVDGVDAITRQAGDSSDGVIARRQIAEVLVRSLVSDRALRKTFGLIATTGLARDDFDAPFAPLNADPAPAKPSRTESL
jgi:hypothetical protein